MFFNIRPGSFDVITAFLLIVAFLGDGSSRALLDAGAAGAVSIPKAVSVVISVDTRTWRKSRFNNNGAYAVCFSNSGYESVA
jgi:hypothetical protein